MSAEEPSARTEIDSQGRVIWQQAPGQAEALFSSLAAEEEEEKGED